jgi:pyruvate dehydrogenase E1 component beta subunit
MPKKGFEYAYYEAVQQEMKRDENVIYWYENQSPVATFGRLPIINLDSEFGRPRVNMSGIDEMWYVAAAFGASRAGLRTISIIPSMADALAFHHLAEYPKIYCGSGGDEAFPIVIVQQVPAQVVGGGQSHSDYECDSWYMHVPCLKTVVPSTAYDAKGLMVSAIRSDDPVIYLMSGDLRATADDVPDEPYEVPIGKAAVRKEGKDITIVTSGPGAAVCGPAVEQLTKDGTSVEYIDLRTLKPLDRKTLVESVQKTGRLLTVDMSYYTLCPGAEVIATCAEGAPGAKFKRIAFPDIPPLGAPEFVYWQKPNPEQVIKAAHMLLKT